MSNQFPSSSQNTTTSTASSPPRHWHGSIGDRYEHHNVWVTGGSPQAYQPARRASSFSEASTSNMDRRVRPLITPLSFNDQANMCCMCRHPTPTPRPTPATRTLLPPASVTADDPATQSSSAGCQLRKETPWIPAWRREGKVGRNSPIREVFCPSGGMGIPKVISGCAGGDFGLRA